MRRFSRIFFLSASVFYALFLSGCALGELGDPSAGSFTSMAKQICGDDGKGACVLNSGGLCEGDTFVFWIEPTSGSQGIIEAVPMSKTVCINAVGVWYPPGK